MAVGTTFTKQNRVISVIPLGAAASSSMVAHWRGALCSCHNHQKCALAPNAALPTSVVLRDSNLQHSCASASCLYIYTYIYIILFLLVCYGMFNFVLVLLCLLVQLLATKLTRQGQDICAVEKHWKTNHRVLPLSSGFFRILETVWLVAPVLGCRNSNSTWTSIEKIATP